MTNPQVDIVTAAQTTAVRAIAAELMLPHWAGKREVLSEIVRAVTHASTRRAPSVPEHTLVDRATAVSGPIFRSRPAEVRRRVLEMVEELEGLGDLARLVNGNWVCAPPQVVGIDGAGRGLLISGFPLRALNPATRARSSSAGVLRRIDRLDDVDLPLVGLETWTRPRGAPIAEWTDFVMYSALGVSEKETVQTADYRFYLPGRADRNARQEARWFPTDSSLNGRYLARVRLLTGGVVYQVVELVDGRVTSARAISGDTARSLMYGLDWQSGNTTEALIRTTSAGGNTELVSLRVFNALPHAETRQLAAVAAHVFEKEWLLPREYSEGLPALSGLGMNVVTE